MLAYESGFGMLARPVVAAFANGGIVLGLDAALGAGSWRPKSLEQQDTRKQRYPLIRRDWRRSRAAAISAAHRSARASYDRLIWIFPRNPTVQAVSPS